MDGITIYQMPLPERILGILSMAVLLPIPILGLAVPLYKDAKGLLMMLLLLIGVVAYCVLMCLNIFMTYIRLDAQNGKLVIREVAGIRKEEIPLQYIIGLQVSDGIQRKESFTIDIHYTGYVKRISSWSAPTNGRLVLFDGYKRQTKRLQAFVEACNAYLIANPSHKN